MPVLIDSSFFKCTYCNERIDITKIPKQDLIHRLERPVPFHCPHCHKKVVFKPKTMLFRVGLISCCILPLPIYLYLNNTLLAFLLILTGASCVIYSLLANKLGKCTNT